MKMEEINFPTRGLSEAYSYDDQPKGGFNQQTGVFGGGTTPRALNVSSYDPRTGRRRGASRCGLSKYCTAAVNGTRAIQDVTHIVTLEDISTTRLLEDGTLRTLESGVFRTLSNSTINTGQRTVTVLAVSGGSIYNITSTAATLVTNGGGALLSDKYTIFSQPYQQDVYYCDGMNYKVYDVSAGAVTTWAATTGTIPEGANLICQFNGRLVLAGFTSNPQNYAMSAVDDARDWNFSPTTLSATMAVAGNNTQGAGLVGDLITALMPFRDDTMLFGCANSIYRMSGDPAAGGRIDLVSTITGVAWGRAFCVSPEGVMYFVGSRGGIFKLDPTGVGVPQRITALVLDERFADLDMDDNLFRLEWDDRAIGVRIFITPKDGSGTTHYFYDLRNDAWWPETYTNASYNPLTVHLLEGYSSGERVVLLGCQDSYIRMIDVDATADDGQRIESEVWLGPMNNRLLLEMQATFSNDSGNVTWSIHTASELETALAASASASGRFTAGRNRSQWPRRHINSGYLRLASTEPWSLEKMLVGFDLDTAQRARIF